MENFDWEKVDVVQVKRNLDTLINFRGDIIGRAVFFELFLDSIICKIFVGNYSSEKASLLQNTVLSRQLSFRSKLEILEIVVKHKRPSKMRETLDWIRGLKRVNDIRNYLAHGHVSNDLPIKDLPYPEITLSLIKKGKVKPLVLSAKARKEIKKECSESFKFILAFVDEGLEPYIGISQSK